MAQISATTQLQNDLHDAIQNFIAAMFSGKASTDIPNTPDQIAKQAANDFSSAVAEAMDKWAVNTTRTILPGQTSTGANSAGPVLSATNEPWTNIKLS